MSYRVEVERRARKQLSRIQPGDRERILAAIDALAEEPRPRNSRSLSGESGYRLRIGDYRALYLVDDDERAVTVTRVGHRQGSTAER